MTYSQHPDTSVRPEDRERVDMEFKMVLEMSFSSFGLKSM